MEGLIMAAQIILSLSILVGLHEGGHLLAAKAFGMRVEQFSIGFPPKIFSFKYGETEYALSAIPLGGFVKISGMIDESMDVDAMKEEPKPWEFRSKPAWQRLIVMLGGIIVNVITGIIIFIFLTFIFGDDVISKDAVNENGGIVALELGRDLGLETGDKIIKIAGKDFEDFQQALESDLFLSDDASYTVLRNGIEKNISIPADFIENLNDEDAIRKFIFPMVPPIVESVEKGSIAERIGLKNGDFYLSVNNKEIKHMIEFQEAVKSFEGDSLSFAIRRGNEELSYTVDFRKDTMIGTYFQPLKVIYPGHIDYSFSESIPLGTQRAFGIIFSQIKAFRKIFRGELNVGKSLSGPIGLAKAYGGKWDWYRFWRMTGMLSMVLAFMNLLPIPALDGGHVMFLTYEIVSGRKPSDKFLENAQKVGMVILLLLMVFVLGNDIYKLIVEALGG